MWRDRPPVDDVVRYTVGPEAALDMLDVLNDPALRDRVLERVETLGDVCAIPFPVIRMLGADSPGYRARVALVEHPEHGRSVCKIFRPGAMEFFQPGAGRPQPAGRPAADAAAPGARAELAAHPRVHRRRRPPPAPPAGHPGMDQLRPGRARALADFARALHDRGLFMLDLSPQNLISDPWPG